MRCAKVSLPRTTGTATATAIAVSGHSLERGRRTPCLRPVQRRPPVEIVEFRGKINTKTQTASGSSRRGRHPTSPSFRSPGSEDRGARDQCPSRRILRKFRRGIRISAQPVIATGPSPHVSRGTRFLRSAADHPDRLRRTLERRYSCAGSAQRRMASFFISCAALVPLMICRTGRSRPNRTAPVGHGRAKPQPCELGGASAEQSDLLGHAFRIDLGGAGPSPRPSQSPVVEAEPSSS